MREYGQIQCSFWSDPDIQGVSNEAKLIAAYLLTGPHSNGIGCYRMPDGYIQADLGMSSQTISKGFAELFGIGFCLRCNDTNFVVMPKFLKWNPISNPKVASAREKEFRTIPQKFSHYNILCGSIITYGNHISNGFETVLKGYAKQDPILSDPNHTLSEPDPDPEKDPTKTPMSGKPDNAAKVLEHLNLATGRSYKPVEANLKLIRARLKEGHSSRDMMRVIDRKCREWPPGHKMHEYLRPATLFNAEKFNQYIGALDVETPEEKNAREVQEWLNGADSNDEHAIDGELADD